MRQQPREIVRLELAGDFQGWWADVDMDLSLGVLSALESGSVGKITAALPKLLVAWNFVGKDGEELPCTLEGCQAIGKALLNAFLEAFNGAIRLPNR